jgi:electron transport complex protein RnfD
MESTEKQVQSNQKIRISPFPHLKNGRTTRFAMQAVVMALLPVVGVSIYLFGWRVLALILWTCVGSMIAEFATLAMRKQRIKEGSAMVTGLILALTLPPTLPYWMGFLGGVIAIVIGKAVYGGTGYNFFNPAAVGRVFLLLSFTSHMTTWVKPFDGMTAATPLAEGTADWWTLLLGNVGGSLGETSGLAIIFGGIILLLLGVINWCLPLGTIIGSLVMSWALGADPIFHLLSGGLLFGAVFMATDWVTTPLHKTGKWIFGLGLGALTIIIRIFGSYPEGFSFALLFMNALTPIINRTELSLRNVRRNKHVHTALAKANN